MMASPSPHMMLLLFLTSALLAAAVRPATSSSSPPPSGTSPEHVPTFCSGQAPDSNNSSSSLAVDAVFREDEYTATVVFNATPPRLPAPAAHPPPLAPPPAGHTPPPRLPPPAAVHSPLAPPAGYSPRPPPAASPVETQLAQQSHGKKTPKTLIMLILSIATGIVVITVILLVHIWYRRRKHSNKMQHVVAGIPGENMYDQEDGQWSMEDEEDKDGERMTCQLYSYQVLEAATCHFSNRNKLGSGGFGTVYKGILANGREVAVKRLRDSKRNLQELEREISIVATLCHKNLVRFLGYCFQDEGKFLVYEYVPNNSLDKFGYKACSQSQKLEWATWFNIILGVARGLQFLHDKGIIHRDLKPHNVLLDENVTPKIADFDLMRTYDKQKTHESTEKVAGTFGYIAPECTSGRKFLLSIKSDVYSYGVLVLEVITGHKIYTFEGQKSEGLVEYVWQHWEEKRAGDIMDDDLLGVAGQELAARQAQRCVHVALLCVQSDRSRRPTMGQVIAMLTSDDGGMELPEPSLPGYLVVVHPRALVRLPCLGYR
ncbi:proline-rich receptor-like protein kinase PERK9 isoform X2 [Panicum virgatum]|uniref:Protein kinase domain-containing protein n=1 Tax=Panicum virgatum TaxID=38727 RepID=A0A8T0PTR4_PANVG|nr:proline-rich receptor-like protein kinase PERK9 isoform X2 [Panicum virgatum]KAG2565817.1 hypothetical protein PVAP13_7NG144300 [Panicum virgatum]